jgi:hypothetical protein
LTRKLCNVLNGLDLSQVHVGDNLDLPNAMASMLVREGWAEVLNEESGHIERLTNSQTHGKKD